MRALILVALFATAQSGCAVLPGDEAASSACTRIVTTQGGVLQFCETAKDVSVRESPLDRQATAHDIRLINDPKALLALQREITLQPGRPASRRLIAKACTVPGDTFVSIALRDLKRIIEKRPVSTPAATDL